jgi:hypothetical protein
MRILAKGYTPRRGGTQRWHWLDAHLLGGWRPGNRDASSSFKDGVLELKLPKHETAKTQAHRHYRLTPEGKGSPSGRESK